MGTYSGFLLLEDLFDYLPEYSTALYNEANQLFNPMVKIVEDDCGTLLGRRASIDNSAVGLWDVALDARLKMSDIDFFLGQGVYSRYVRHPAYCTSTGGVCKKCYEAQYPGSGSVSVGHLVRLSSEIGAGTASMIVTAGETALKCSSTGGFISRVEVYINDIFVPEPSVTFIDDTTVSVGIPSDVPVGSTVFVRMVKETASPFVSYLSSTYSGSLLGSAFLETGILPARVGLLQERITSGRLSALTKALEPYSEYIPPSYMDYVANIRDPLEKELYILALYGVFSDVGV